MTEEELEAIAKGGLDVAMDIETEGAGGEATRRLLGDYQTPARSVLFLSKFYTAAVALSSAGSSCCMPCTSAGNSDDCNL